jgi:hypothetical protein
MRSRFEVTASSLPGDEAPPLEPSRWGPLLLSALIFALAACSAALLVR